MFGWDGALSELLLQVKQLMGKRAKIGISKNWMWLEVKKQNSIAINACNQS